MRRTDRITDTLDEIRQRMDVCRTRAWTIDIMMRRVAVTDRVKILDNLERALHAVDMTILVLEELINLYAPEDAWQRTLRGDRIEGRPHLEPSPPNPTRGKPGGLGGR